MAALRWGVGIAIALLGVVWAAWRSGDRPPVDEVAIAEARLGIELESRIVPTGAAALHVVFAGPEDGEPEGETLSVFQSAWARENAISSMIGVYRAEWEPIALPEDGRPGVPVRFVAGGQDAYIPHAAVDVTAGFLPEGALALLPEASHWLLLEEPQEIGRLLIEFFREERG